MLKNWLLREMPANEHARALQLLCCSRTQPHHLVNRCESLQVFNALDSQGINVQMMSQGASKTNISLIIDEEESTKAVQSIHKEFF